MAERTSKLKQYRLKVVGSSKESSLKLDFFLFTKVSLLSTIVFQLP